MYEIINQISHYFTILMIMMMIGGMTLFNTSPAYYNFKNGVFFNSVKENYTMQFSVYYKWPRYDQNENFWVSTCINLWLSYTCSVSVCIIDLYLSIVIFQIIGHIQILKYNLEHFPQPKNNSNNDLPGSTSSNNISKYTGMFSDEENKVIRKMIREYVDHHRLIVRCVI
jgi:hypothetical protein